MSIEVEAIYEDGVFRPTKPLTERSKVILTIRKPLDVEALRSVRGCLSTAEAVEMMELIREGRRVEGDW